MVKAIFITLLVLFTCNKINAQDHVSRNPVIQNVPGINLIDRVVYFNQNRGFVAGQNGIFVTSNAGADWTHVYGDSNIHLYDAEKQNALTAYAVGSTMEAPLLRYVVRTTNAGITWESVTVPGSSPLYAISIKNNIIEIFGSGNELVASTDNGNSWQQYYANNGWNFIPSDVARKGGKLFVAIGALYKSDNRVDWVRDTVLSNIGAQCIADNGRNVFVAGFGMNNYKPAICYSSNGGNSWRKVFLPGIGYITGIEFENERVGYACGVWRADTSSQDSRGIIYKTVNGGRSWFKFYRTQTQEYGLRDIEIINRRLIFSLTNSLWVFGSHHSNSVNDKSDEMLKQNFPNPFNPTTKISYTIPYSGFLKLEVFDISGRQLVTLVNEPKTAGTHSVEFNGNNFSSGTYFYKITAGEFIETKMMVLIK